VSEARAWPQVLVDRPERGIMVMYKPSGWATCSTPHWEGNEGNLIRHVWRHLNTPTAAPCHRLDKGTSGIVVVATSKVASKHICQQISQKTLVKQYIGLCHGHISPAAGAFSAPLALSNTDKPLGTCSTEGREAVTRFRVLGYFSNADSQYSLVQVQIDHGRQHQIRLHMASLGHPLVSDPKYNAAALREDAEICPRLFLHACFLRCMLPPSEDSPEETFSVACRLPAELKHALLAVLTWQRDFDAQLTLEAQRLCECLLASEHLSGQGDPDSLHASRLVIRRRDDFLHRFGFNGQERAEVTRILSTLPTARERSAALQQFRVLGQRTPDFIVARFGKYVEGLLRWRKPPDAAGEEGEEDVGSPDSISEPSSQPCRAPPEKADERSVPEREPAPGSEGCLDPVRQVLGPVRIHAEPVWCDVCGCEERQVSLAVPGMALRIRVSVPSHALPPWLLAVARANEELEAPPATKRKANKERQRVQQPPAHEPEEAGKPRKPDRGSEKEAAKPRKKEGSGDKEASKSGEPEGGGDGEAMNSEALRAQREIELQQVVKDFVAEYGGAVDGIWVASKIAARFNQWIRTNSKRNDGSLRRWVGTIPGISVEHCGKNKWRVHIV